MTHVQKPDFVFRRNGRVHLNRQGTSVQSTTGNRGVRFSGSNGGYIMLWGSVKSTGYPSIRQFPLHFHARASPCAITFQLDSATAQQRRHNILQEDTRLCLEVFRKDDETIEKTEETVAAWIRLKLP